MIRQHLSPKASISLQTLQSGTPPSSTVVRGMIRPMGAASEAASEPRVSVICTLDPAAKNEWMDRVGAIAQNRVEYIADGFVAAELPIGAVQELIDDPQVLRIHSVKQKQLRVSEAADSVGIRSGGARVAAATGRNTYIAIVDSGFDLSHPMFRDAAGNLRVDALLDQTQNNREFTRHQLENAWYQGQGPGADKDGHGTHVATIAAGSLFAGLEGMAPDARFLLVKTDFVNLAPSVRWAFRKAGATPCVANLSLGHHFGPHDGTEAEERALSSLIGPGKIIVAAAGNERNDRLHIGGRFNVGQSEIIGFDCDRNDQGRGQAVMTLWIDASDRFDISVTSPMGARLDAPLLTNESIQTTANGAFVKFSRLSYDFNNLVQIQIEITFASLFAPPQALRGWRLRIECQAADLGRIDGWFANIGFGRFREHHMVETARTVGMPSTAVEIISVASHVSKTAWVSVLGPQQDRKVVVGRTSEFSGRGPSRSGGNKPEVSAAGQYLTSALASGSSLETQVDRSDAATRLGTIDGTSMACPVVSGIIALVLQNLPNLTTQQLRQVLKSNSLRDAHTGPLDWTPEYGYGKASATGALAALSPVPGGSGPARAQPPRPRRGGKKKKEVP